MSQRILLIDAAKAVDEQLAAFLAGEAVALESALDASAGLALATASRPDLILLDVDGGELLIDAEPGPGTMVTARLRADLNAGVGGHGPASHSVRSVTARC